MCWIIGPLSARFGGCGYLLVGWGGCLLVGWELNFPPSPSPMGDFYVPVAWGVTPKFSPIWKRKKLLTYKMLTHERLCLWKRATCLSIKNQNQIVPQKGHTKCCRKRALCGRYNIRSQQEPFQLFKLIIQTNFMNIMCGLKTCQSHFS